MSEWLWRLVCGCLGELLAAVLRNLRAARADDPALVAFVLAQVREAAAQPALNGPQMRSRVIGRVRDYLAGLGRDVSDAALNALVELAVQRVKTDGVA